jgi:predicted transcriptional regulator
MDKIFSTRVDESVIHRIGSLARRLRTSKKRVIEKAVETYAAQVEREQKSDVLEETFGAWRRKESAAQTVDDVRATFRRAMERHQR